MTPRILTLDLDAESFRRLDAWRQQFFPPERNFLRAHLTLFHALPDTAGPFVLQAARRSPFAVAFTRLRRLSGGMAIDAVAPEIASVRAPILEALRSVLTPQDRAPHAPHVTVMNKASAADASRAWQELQASFVPWEGRALGIALWRYLGGPWELENRVPFDR